MGNASNFKLIHRISTNNLTQIEFDEWRCGGKNIASILSPSCCAFPCLSLSLVRFFHLFAAAVCIHCWLSWSLQIIQLNWASWNRNGICEKFIATIFFLWWAFTYVYMCIRAEATAVQCLGLSNLCGIFFLNLLFAPSVRESGICVIKKYFSTWPH